MKRILTFLSALVLAGACAVSAAAAEPIPGTQEISGSGGYAWAPFSGRDGTLNVLNWGG